jgi:hypothetical protein
MRGVSVEGTIDDQLQKLLILPSAPSLKRKSLILLPCFPFALALALACVFAFPFALALALACVLAFPFALALAVALVANSAGHTVLGLARPHGLIKKLARLALEEPAARVSAHIVA